MSIKTLKSFTLHSTSQKSTMSVQNAPITREPHGTKPSAEAVLQSIPNPTLSPSESTKRPLRKAALASLEKVSTLYAPFLLSEDNSPSSASETSPTTYQAAPPLRVNHLFDDSSGSDEFIDDLEPGLSAVKRRAMLKKRKSGNGGNCDRTARGGKAVKGIERLDKEDLELVGLMRTRRGRRGSGRGKRHRKGQPKGKCCEGDGGVDGIGQRSEGSRKNASTDAPRQGPGMNLQETRLQNAVTQA